MLKFTVLIPIGKKSPELKPLVKDNSSESQILPTSGLSKSTIAPH